ncbi:MAG: YgiQ family radical SAM protein [Clostridia bacterium]|nr:YgiQ family radical SAM protein [Clostridia bacterium]
MRDRRDFLPVTLEDVRQRRWAEIDFVYVTGDAYVDHPSFGASIITRVLENEGFRVAVLAQPDYKSCEDFKRFGRPRLGFLVSSGNIDSMVAHYTVSKKKRTYDYYSAGGKMGARPDRALIVYCNRIREAYGDVPIIVGGLEASLRRFAHYDYWDDRVRRSILVDSRADILTYGMGENIIKRIAALLDKGVPVRKIRDVRGTVYLAKSDEKPHFDFISVGDYDTLKTDKSAYAKAFAVQYKNTDSVNGRAVVESYGDKILVQNPPMPPLEREELDEVYALPYARDYHPDYESEGGVPAINEVKFSITHNRGCFGACNFCAIAFHQGREVRSRSVESVVAEAKIITEMPDFKGYINDVGGPTANFRYPSCDKQKKDGVCPTRKCLSPTPCKNLKVDHTEYANMLSEIEALPKIKKVFVRSGIRFDYLSYDKDDSFFRQLVTRHVSGQLKVAPEHCSNSALAMMGKPPIEVYERFRSKYFSLCKEAGLEQYLVPYLMSSHPGATMNDAVEMALWLKKWGYMPEQVQDFYPTPGTISTVMYYTGIHPMTGKTVYVTTDYNEKKLQRALLQYSKPENANLVREALRIAGREDLIGLGPDCLVRPAFGKGTQWHPESRGKNGTRSARGTATTKNGSKFANGTTSTKNGSKFANGTTSTKNGSKSANGVATKFVTRQDATDKSIGKSKKQGSNRSNANKSLQKENKIIFGAHAGFNDGAKSTRSGGRMGLSGRSKKLDRVFGSDALRIRKEADRLSSGANQKKASKRAKVNKNG